VNQRFIDLSQNEKELLLSSESESKYKIGYKSNKRKHTKTSKYKGPLLELWEGINNNKVSTIQKKYLSQDICENCKGTRFSQDTLNFQIDGKNIGELYMMELDLLLNWIENHKVEWDKFSVIKRAFCNIERFLHSAVKLNLEYLNLNRSIPTLSGGELQRLRLAKALNSQFFNFLYVLDEPTSGLHPCEWPIISELIFDLKKMGNTVLIIEHNEFLKKIADTTIYLGPGGGKDGGRIDRKEDLKKSKDVLKYTFFKPSKFANINDASYNNIKNINISLPVNSLIGVCGTSGSGKSSFLYGILPRYLNDVVYLNQSPIRGNYYSIVATALGIFNNIQELYSKTNKVTKEFFTYISKGKGQCNTCQGKGFLKEDSLYIETEIVCPSCEGKRFSNSALKYKFKGLNIHELLSLSVDELFFLIESDDKILKILNFTKAMGMGYLNLFQNVSHLSGGEAQRVKLLKSLFEFSTKKTFLLDEPFRGVDGDNIKGVILAFYNLVEKGYTIYIAEHNILAINYCSYIIEFGPKNGKYGGKVIFYDQRKLISKSDKSVIKNYLPDIPID
jgi:excinuclease ABC subunit A